MEALFGLKEEAGLTEEEKVKKLKQELLDAVQSLSVKDILRKTGAEEFSALR